MKYESKFTKTIFSNGVAHTWHAGPGSSFGLGAPTLTEEEGPMLFGQNFNKRSDTENIFVSSLAEEYMFFIIPI